MKILILHEKLSTKVKQVQLPISVLAGRAKSELNLSVIFRRSTQPNCGESRNQISCISQD